MKVVRFPTRLIEWLDQTPFDPECSNVAMGRLERPQSRVRNGTTAPRRIAVILALFTWLIVIPFAHGVVPWAISRITSRYGWERGVPGLWNEFGLVLVAAAAALLIWILVTGIADIPDTVRLGLTPSVLLTHGPYRFSRNPMYVAELGLWLGWALYFGSLEVLVGCVVLLVIVNFVILPREERGLESAFGQLDLQYKMEVPRWLGRMK